MEDEGVLTPAKMERIIRVRLRYRAGFPVPRDDLYRIGVSVDVAGAKEVIGLYLDPRREPTLEGNIAPTFPLVSLVDCVT